MYKQLDIYWINLNPAISSKTNKERPCVILQSNILNNKATRTIIICPLLPDNKPWPFVVNLKPSKTNGLDKKRHINLKQLRVVDIARLTNKQGTLEKNYLPEIKEKLQLIFDI